MGANSSSLNHSPDGGAKLTHRQIRHFRRQTKFDSKEVKQQYQTLLKHFPSGKFNKEDYRNARNATVNDDIMVEFWFDICDTDGNGIIDVKEFLCAQSVLSKGSLEDKVEVVFRMYDVDHDGYLTRAEMLHMTKMAYKAEDYPLEEADSFVDEAFSKMDQNRDGMLTERELCNGIKKLCPTCPIFNSSATLL